MADDTTAPEPLTVREYVNAQNAVDVRLANNSAAEADELVSRHIGGKDNPHDVPATLIARAVLEVGADLYWRHKSRNGVVQLGSGVEAAGPVRINRDPMTMAYELLSPFLPAAIG